jgi:signal-transduction protein with cAMP-binding, CBS, and nucleotidyltransferase domain
MFFDTVSALLCNAGATSLNSVAPDATVIEAVRLMNRNAIGAVLVVNSNGLAGILTERDVIQRIVAAGRNSTITPVHEVMTPNPQTVRTGESAVRALDLMTRGDFRHLPVTDGETIQGVLSIRDLNRWLTGELKTQVEAALVAVKSMSLAENTSREKQRRLERQQAFHRCMDKSSQTPQKLRP